MRFEDFSQTAEDINSVSSNLEIEDMVSELLVESGDDLDVVTRFIRGEVFPNWDDTKMSIGPSLAKKAIVEASSLSEDEVDEKVAEVGDIGRASQEIDLEGDQKTLSPDELEVSDVYDKFEYIANQSGSGSQSRKVNAIADLLRRSSELGSVYILKLCLGKMRIGVGDGTVRKAIGDAFNVDPDDVEKKYMYCNDMGKVAKMARSGNLDDIEMEVETPVQSMKAQDGSIEDALSDLADDEGSLIVGTKYDGARLQIHKNGDTVRLFSRNMEEWTDSLPEVKDRVLENVDSDDVILDSEVVAYDEDGNPEEFQKILRRVGRKYDIDEMSDEINVDINVFDILYEDGEAVIDDELTDRKELMEKVCDDDIIGDYWEVSSSEEVKDKNAKAIGDGHEGLIAKKKSSVFKPNKRGKNWMKIKPEIETLDCVVTGGITGEGEYSDFISSYYIAVRDGDETKGIGKVATGMTEDELEELTDRFEDLTISEDGRELDFKEEVVFEVGYEEIQESPDYDSGYALRFPRFIAVRDDKDISEADSISRVERIKG